VIFLILVQGLPLLALGFLFALWGLGFDFLTLKLAIAVNGGLLLMRWGMLLAIYPSYYREARQTAGTWAYWLSPLADPLAVSRIILSASQTPKQWRGRVY
jgi:dolichol-phosphate mannosyltransferase